MEYYLAEEARFRVIETGSLVAAVIVALLIGFLLALYYGDLQRRMRDLYYGATRDDLTGLLNRRGAKEAVNKSLIGHAGCTMLLVAVDHLKLIVAMHGHNAADALIAHAAEAIRQSIGEGDICARLGEGEFMVFITDSDVAQAKDTADRILARLSRRGVLAGASPTVSIGIAAYEGVETAAPGRGVFFIAPNGRIRRASRTH
jgi:diguanylate cyclase (GGDEF)-like protein